MRLLSVDWDYFFPVPSPIEDKDFLYDWGHAENGPLLLSGIWPIRAAQFLAEGLPLPGTSGEEETFWKRFHFGSAPVLFYADSHSQIFKPEVMHKVKEVVNFDAHHDAYATADEVFEKKSVDCASWATGYRLCHVDVRVIYPQWDAWMLEDTPRADVHVELDKGLKHKHRYEKVFVCRSGAWTPSWLEDKFWKFLKSCPIQTKVCLDGITYREFDPKEAEEAARVIKRVREEARHDNANRNDHPKDV